MLTPLTKNVLVPLGLTAAALVPDAAIQKERFESGTTLVVSNEKMDDTMKIIKFLKEFCLLVKCVDETIKKEIRWIS